MSPLQGTEIGINVEALERSVDPGNDFYRYANGGWIAATALDDGQQETGPLLLARQRLHTQLREMLENPSRQSARLPEQIDVIYRSFTDEAAIERDGLRPLWPDLQRFVAVRNTQELSRILGEQSRSGAVLQTGAGRTRSLFNLVASGRIGDDAVAHVTPGGLGLPDAGMYSSNARADVQIRSAYLRHIAEILQIAGFSDTRTRAARILELETQIAAVQEGASAANSLSQAQVRTFDDLDRQGGGLEWGTYADAAGFQRQSSIALSDPVVIDGLSQLIGSQALIAWKEWLIFHQIDGNADLLPNKVRSAHYRFQKTLSGGEAQPSRRSAALRFLSHYYNDALGQEYAERFLTQDQRRDLEIIFARVRNSLLDRLAKSESFADDQIDALQQLDDPEKERGPAMELKIDLNSASLYDIAGAVREARYARWLKLLRKPVDAGGVLRSAEGVSIPVGRRFSLAAEFVQPPFYNPAADPAANYGALGVIIASRLARLAHPAGQMNMPEHAGAGLWAGAGSGFSAAFMNVAAGKEGSDNPARQAELFQLAGLVAAHDAYRASLAGKEPPVIQGFTGDQRFFIAYAQSLALKHRNEETRPSRSRDATTDSADFVSAVRHHDAWYRAFDVEPGDALYLPPDDRLML
ncbi:M13 family metallopeptidase [Croceicoccus sp. F390]|uniref:M13 family metallopeptidase n=1 Tax=Croceicoccus esteveae TaxID=3075597 RepID=A0ABU2ZFI3_9SPHN|nr:M13 family metallopeptidase [Croceicoccus sp. F390]MDT0575116.1 M13 family metallopeptidase [Croceicoccus sp. F390]